MTGMIRANGPRHPRLPRRLTIKMLRQQAWENEEKTVQQVLMEACPAKGTWDRERFEYEREYHRMFTSLGFEMEDTRRKLSSFSGGEKTKIALIGLLLERPDILLLDEPTNHLDLETVQWLERYLRTYDRAVVMVSHDRFFLDRTAEVVYELEGKTLTRYAGNYTEYREEKQKAYERQKKAYERQQEEIARQEQLIKRFKNKPTKASMARSRKKVLERMERIPKPAEDMAHIFTGEITPLIGGSKWVLEAEHLKIGYDQPLLELGLRIRRGQKIGILGENGSGKSTFLKTAAGFLEPLREAALWEIILPSDILTSFPQRSSRKRQWRSNFSDLFPALTEKEVRSILGAYLFKGKDASKRVSSLSGGRKSQAGAGGDSSQPAQFPYIR